MPRVLIDVRGLALACQQPIKKSRDRNRNHDARGEDLPMSGKQPGQIVLLRVVRGADADQSGYRILLAPDRGDDAPGCDGQQHDSGGLMERFRQTDIVQEGRDEPCPDNQRGNRNQRPIEPSGGLVVELRQPQFGQARRQQDAQPDPDQPHQYNNRKDAPECIAGRLMPVIDRKEQCDSNQDERRELEKSDNGVDEQRAELAEFRSHVERRQKPMQGAKHSSGDSLAHDRPGENHPQFKA